MVSGTACRPVRGAPSSSAAGGRDALVSAPEGRRYTSLSGSDSFDAVFSTGRRRRRGGLTVITAPGLDGQIRVGLVASRKVGGAVVRNRAKRRLRAALDMVELVRGRDYVVIASRDVIAASFSEVVEWLQGALGADGGVLHTGPSASQDVGETEANTGLRA